MRAWAISLAVALTLCEAAVGPQAQVQPDHAVSLLYNRSLGVDCSRCHVGGDWTDASKPARQMAKVMSAIFDLIPTYFDGTVRMPRTQCYMCHQGHVRVERACP
jgi:hypothetical protein